MALKVNFNDDFFKILVERAIVVIMKFIRLI